MLQLHRQPRPLISPKVLHHVAAARSAAAEWRIRIDVGRRLVVGRLVMVEQRVVIVVG